MDEGAGDAGAVPQGRRVHWLELFFDLVMAAYIGQIATRLHGDPGWVDGLVFAVLLATAWWAWVNASVTMNLFGARIGPTMWVAGCAAMAAIGLMAAAVPAALDARAGAFAVGNAAIRLVWMVPWFVKRSAIGGTLWRPVVYNVVPAGLWLASVFVPSPWRFGLWLVAVAIEVVLLATIRRTAAWLLGHLDLDHMIERVHLLIVIVFGETVLAIVARFADTWTVAAAGTAAAAFAVVALLAWMYFTFAVAAVERGLHRLRAAGSLGGLRDAVMYLPFVVIAGIGALAAGLGTAVADGGGTLPAGAAVCVAAGLSLFFAASVAESLRYRARWRDVAMWAPAGVLLPWTVVPVARAVPGWAAISATLVVVAVLAVLNTVNARLVADRRAAEGAV